MDRRELYYFIADTHLGLRYGDYQAREKVFASFLQQIPKDAKAVYLLGDIFDFWYEYKDVVPRGYTRTLGALAALADAGVEVHFFNGNHDIWTYGYFEQELGFVMERNQPAVVRLCGKNFCLAHGDALAEGDRGYKVLKSVFTCRFLQRLFSCLHPRLAFKFGYGWSRHNRLAKGINYRFRGEDEPIVQFAERFQQRRGQNDRIDYFIFGHYHFDLDTELKGGGRLFLLGEGINRFDYLLFDGRSLRKLYYSQKIE